MPPTSLTAVGHNLRLVPRLAEAPNPDRALAPAGRPDRSQMGFLTDDALSLSGTACEPIRY